MIIRKLEKTHIPVIVSRFEKSGWQTKLASTFEQYLDEQNSDKRICLVAFVDNEFAGYVTLKWSSNYQNFANERIPEISDLNVLPNHRNKGIGTSLIEKCEAFAEEKADIVGIGVGLYPDYGSAQRLYIKRGYIPDGNGATYNYEHVTPGKEYPVDDDLVLWFTKKLN